MGRGGQVIGRRLKLARGSLAGGFPGEIGGQQGVGLDGSPNPVPQRGAARSARGRQPVEACSFAHGQVMVDGGPVQRMSESQRPAQRAIDELHEAGGRLLGGFHRPLDGGHRGGVGKPGLDAEHRRGADEAARIRTGPGQRGEGVLGEALRGGQPPYVDQAVRWQLRQQRLQVQRIAAGVRLQALGVDG